MKTSSTKNYTAEIFDLFINNRSLAGTISKWISLNTVMILYEKDLNITLAGFESQNTFAQQFENS